MFESKPFKQKERQATIFAWLVTLLPMVVFLTCLAIYGIKAFVVLLLITGAIFLITLIAKNPLAALLGFIIGANL